MAGIGYKGGRRLVLTEALGGWEKRSTEVVSAAEGRGSIHGAGRASCHRPVLIRRYCGRAKRIKKNNKISRIKVSTKFSAYGKLYYRLHHENSLILEGLI